MEKVKIKFLDEEKQVVVTTGEGWRIQPKEQPRVYLPIVDENKLFIMTYDTKKKYWVIRLNSTLVQDLYGRKFDYTKIHELSTPVEDNGQRIGAIPDGFKLAMITGADFYKLLPIDGEELWWVTGSQVIPRLDLSNDEYVPVLYEEDMELRIIPNDEEHIKIFE